LPQLFAQAQRQPGASGTPAGSPDRPPSRERESDELPRLDGPAGPQGTEQGAYRRQLWLIPAPANATMMRTFVFRPPGEGPFPLVVLNHGSWEWKERRAKFGDPTFALATEWFIERGYAVAIPQRPGHGKTGGPYLEAQNGCANADFFKAGLGTADSIMAAITYLRTQPFVRGDDIIVLGQSAGGWGAIALASRNPPGVKAIINVAGGRGGRSYDKPNNNCAPERLADAAGRFGRTARIPTLWLYTRNDTFFAPELSRRMSDEYRNAGGVIEFHLLPAFGEEGHELLFQPAGMKIWAPVIENFLANVK
jgi:dienelactone hydrolase